MVENAIYRYKTIIGRGMRSRTLEGQRVEVQLACRVLNTMTRLGMPDSYRVGSLSLSGNGGTCAQFRAMQQRPIKASGG